MTVKQARFVEEYTVDFNATQAALRAGYSEKTAHAIGWENLRKPEIAKALKERLDTLSMSADEALKRLTDMGRGTLSPFITAFAGNEDKDGAVSIDLSTETAQEHFHLLKRVKQTRTRTTGKDDYEKTEVRTDIEIHDPKDAVKEIAKIRGLLGAKGTADDPLHHQLLPVQVTVVNQPTGDDD